MKLSKWAFALAIAAAFWPGAAVFAQIGSGVSPQSRTTTPAAPYRYGDYYASQGGQPVAPIQAAPVAEPAEEEEETAPEPWRIAPNNNSLGITFKGWLTQGYAWNPSNPVDKFNGPVTWTDRSNEYQLNELYGIVERTTDTENAVMDIGGRVELNYGSSYRFSTSAGFEDKWNKNHSFYGLSMPAAYAEVAYNDLKVKLGRFVSPVGYNTVGSPNNFFTIIPYTYQYGEPFTHTGAWANYKCSDALTVGAGAIMGWDNSTTEFNNHLGPMFNFTYTRPEISDSLAFVNMWSQEPNFAPFAAGAKPDFSGRYLQTVVYSRPLKRINEDLTFVLQSDFGVQDQATLEGNTALWYGANAYLFWKQNDCWTWGLNGEWFRDEDGFRVGGFLPNFPTVPTQARGLSTARSGYNGNFYQLTFGPKWTPNLNTIIRPNLRWDTYDGGQINNGFNSLSGAFGAPTALRPFDDGTKNWQILFNIDLTLLF